MQINQDLQSAILNAIKQNIDPKASLADELADCLSVSKDSAYRRIRGETLFDISDLEKLTTKHKLSLDSFFGLKKSSVPFNVQSINLVDFTFVDYFKDIEAKLGIILSMESKHLFYSARDIPIFHYFQMPLLGSFKLYFWLKYYLNHPVLNELKFNSPELPKLLARFENSPENSWNLYLKIPSTEIWTYETPNITLRQIEFAHQTGIIDVQTASQLCQQLKELLEHIKVQGSQGNKFTIGSQATLEGAEYNLYFNEVALGDNSLLFKMGTQKMAFNTYGGMNYMSTTDPAYTDFIDNYFISSMKTSTLISGTAEKIRSNFFASLIRKVESIEANLSEHSLQY